MPLDKDPIRGERGELGFTEGVGSLLGLVAIALVLAGLIYGAYTVLDAFFDKF